MWFGIIIYGLCNGFVLLPVMLSLFGPLNFANKKKGVVIKKDKEKDIKESRVLQRQRELDRERTLELEVATER